MPDQLTNPYDALVNAVAARVLEQMSARPVDPQAIQPALYNVKDAATYLGRSEQAIQHLISSKTLPVVRVGRRVHLHTRDLDNWIQKNKY